MIHLIGVTKILRDPHHGTEVLLRGANLSLPTDRAVAIHCRHGKMLSEFLQIIAGIGMPDEGRVVTEGVRFSPVVNAEGRPGSILLPQLTAMENIRLHARFAMVDARRLADLVEQACDFGRLLHLPVSTFDWPMKRALEVALVAATPYGCYLVDRLERLSAVERLRIYRVARLREAGMIFTTESSQVARQFGQIRIELTSGRIHLHESHTGVDGADD